MPEEQKLLSVLGPCIGHTTATTTKIWLHLSDLPKGGSIDLYFRGGRWVR